MATGYRVEPDRGFAWVVLVSSFLNYMISFGVAVNGCSVYLAAMIESYRCSRTEAYVAGALSSALYLCSGPVASVLIDKVGLRVAAVVGAIVTSTGLVLSANAPTLMYHYVTFSVTAIGCCAMCQSAIVVPVHYFVKRRALASGVMFASGGICMMIFPNIVRLIIDAYTWRPSFYIMAAIVLNTCVFSMLIRPSSLIKNNNTELRVKMQEQDVAEVDGTKSDVIHSIVTDGEKNEQAISHASRETIDACDLSNENAQIGDIPSESRETVHVFPGLVRNRFFWLLLANCILFQIALISPTLLMPDMYAVGGMNDWQTSVLFILWGSGNTLGRLLSGILWLKLASPLVVYCLANLVWATTMLLYLGYRNFLCLVFANVLTGLGNGSFMTCFSMVTAELVGVALANRALGFGRLVCGIGGIVAPPIFGKLFDATTSYVWPMLLAAMVGFASFADLLLILCLQEGKKKRIQVARSTTTIPISNP